MSDDDRTPELDESLAIIEAEQRRAHRSLRVNESAVFGVWAVAWGVGFASVEEIDELNILRATGLAMCRAIEQLAVTPVAALVDGNYRFALPCEVQTVVKGDSLSLSIAAASILAKTARDRLMIELDDRHPGYGFARHKGYNAPIHQAALHSLGPCPAHRRTWAPIRALLAQD